MTKHHTQRVSNPYASLRSPIALAVIKNRAVSGVTFVEAPFGEIEILEDFQ